MAATSFIDELKGLKFYVSDEADIVHKCKTVVIFSEESDIEMMSEFCNICGGFQNALTWSRFYHLDLPVFHKIECKCKVYYPRKSLGSTYVYRTHELKLIALQQLVKTSLELAKKRLELDMIWAIELVVSKKLNIEFKMA